jgi:methylenetetrahydrofolate dehydrogenase (NADP+)/methenyltetrahydrofolate cyclohydrolase
MAQIIKGKPVADYICKNITKNIETLKSNNIAPKLVMVRVGNNQNDVAYERGAEKRLKLIGIATEIIELDPDISQYNFIKELEKLNRDEAVNGILIFRPLPEQLYEDIIKYAIAPEKDIDCLSPVNVAKIMENDTSGFLPCTSAAVMEILRHYNIPINGSRAVVMGRSMVVGKPVLMQLLNENATVTICHSKTPDIQDVCANADILVVGIGKAKTVNSNYIKEGAIVIDVGINVDEDGIITGDVDIDNCMDKARIITPVPGGVGAVTTSILAKQVMKAFMQQNGIYNHKT